MKNIFAQENVPDVNLKKNVFDLSHRENLTMDWGKIYPLGEPIEVLPGDKIDLSLSAALHAMPMVFPVQTPMQLKLFVFYVPNRLLWSNDEDSWENYITGVYDNTTKKPVHPFHHITDPNVARRMFSTGGLLDYLGVPTTSVGDFGSTSNFVWENIRESVLSVTNDELVTNGQVKADTPYDPMAPLYITTPANVNHLSRSYDHRLRTYVFNYRLNSLLNHSSGEYSNTSLGSMSRIDKKMSSLFYETDNTLFWDTVDPNLISYAFISEPISSPFTEKIISFSHSRYDINQYSESSTQKQRNYNIQFALLEETERGSNDYFLSYIFGNNGSNDIVHFHNSSQNGITHVRVTFQSDALINYTNYCSDNGLRYRLVLLNLNPYNQLFTSEPFSSNLQPNVLSWCGYRSSFFTSNVNVDEISPNDNPFVAGNKNLAKHSINALPARCYEMCCRSYFLNDKIAPFLDSNNEPIYNKYLRNNTGGADSLEYDFYHANYELDQFTDALPTPQFGPAPLIGVTITSGHSATLHFSADNIVGTGTQSSGGTLDAEVEFTDDNQMKLTGITSYDEQLPSANLRKLMEQVNYGISIQDIRNVNSLQRYKERMQARSYRYRDQIKNHFGQDVSRTAVDMPEYIGGYNFNVEVNKINNTSAPLDADGAPLGDYAGQASIFGKMSRNIVHHCDEHGFIMVLGYVVPRPCYSQVLPKVYSKIVDKFDYYTPEFSKIGYVPMYNYDLAPIQFSNYDDINNTDTLHQVFGYQRAWYDYMSRIDGCHGQFRTTLSDYLAMRLFNNTPQLNARFINVHDEDINNVFSVEDGDHFLGFVDYDLKIVRPIPRFATPSLE